MWKEQLKWVLLWLTLSLLTCMHSAALILALQYNLIAMVRPTFLLPAVGHCQPALLQYHSETVFQRSYASCIVGLSLAALPPGTRSAVHLLALQYKIVNMTGS